MRFFKCKHCGAIVSLATPSKQPSKCCGDAMVELIPNTMDGAVEKHIPVIIVKGNYVTVRIGAIDHPMQDNHHCKTRCRLQAVIVIQALSTFPAFHF